MVVVSNHVSADDANKLYGEFGVDWDYSKAKVVVWKDGSHKVIEDGVTFEYENDDDWLTTIPL